MAAERYLKRMTKFAAVILLTMSSFLIAGNVPTAAAQISTPQLVQLTYGKSVPTSLTPAGSRLYFVLGEEFEGCGPHDYVSRSSMCGISGTPLYSASGSGAKLVYPFSGNQFVSSLVPFGSGLLIIAGRTVWRSNGTRSGTKALATLPGPRTFGSFAYPSAIVPAGSHAFIVGSEQIWITNGTAAGTHKVISLPQIYTGWGDAASHATISGTLYFSARDGKHGMELWKTDGTAGGTHMVKDLNPGPQGSYPGEFSAAGSDLYFLTNCQRNGWKTGWKLYVTRGTASTTHLLHSFPGTSREPLEASETAPHDFFPYGQEVLFSSGVNPGNGELWRSDGTPSGTRILAHVHPGPSNWLTNEFTVMNNKAYFIGASGSKPTALWVSNGTTAGTHEAVSLNAYDNLVSGAGRLYFLGSKGTTTSIWSSDGTPPGTHAISSFADKNVSGVAPGLILSGHSLYFIAQMNSARDRLWTVPVS